MELACLAVLSRTLIVQDLVAAYHKQEHIGVKLMPGLHDLFTVTMPVTMSVTMSVTISVTIVLLWNGRIGFRT